MSDIYFKCPHCRNPLIIDCAGAGLQVGCPHCAQTITVPSKTARKTKTLLVTGIVVVFLVVLCGAAALLVFTPAKPVPKQPELATALNKEPQPAKGNSNVGATTEPNPTSHPPSVEDHTPKLQSGTDANVRVAPDPKDAWRTNMSIFVQEVLAVAQHAIVPDDEAWTTGRPGALNPRLTRLGSILYLQGCAHWCHPAQDRKRWRTQHRTAQALPTRNCFVARGSQINKNRRRSSSARHRNRVSAPQWFRSNATPHAKNPFL